MQDSVCPATSTHELPYCSSSDILEYIPGKEFTAITISHTVYHSKLVIYANNKKEMWSVCLLCGARNTGRSTMEFDFEIALITESTESHTFEF
jgi:hypothetical protein